MLTDVLPHGRIPLVEKNELPSSSSGLGHSPLKAKTGVRVPVGAHFYTVGKYLHKNSIIVLSDQI